jgi:hypothetical protein
MVNIVANFGLADAATGTQTGTVGEPSAAASSTGLFLTGNWYATRSADKGATWQFLDPFGEFPSDRGEFCCDQLVLWVPSQRMWVWLLQYSETGGTNIVRIAVSRTAAPGTWKWWDVSPRDLDPAWTSVWFDFPDMAISDGHLWLSFNQYTPAGAWQRGTVVRYPLSALPGVAGGSTAQVPRQHWSSGQHGSLRFVVGAQNTMWWASNDASVSRLHVFAWPDSSASVESWAVAVAPWDDSDYTSMGPGNSPWLSRADDRVTGGWRLPARAKTASAPAAPARLGWLWTSGRRTGRPHPFIRAVTINENTLKVVAEPDLWSTSGAWAYPAAAPSTRGRVGLAAFFGGGAAHAAHTVGVLDDSTNAWSTTRTAVSTHAPSLGKWGDYLTVRPHPSRPTSWVASGFTLQGGTDRRNIEPRLVIFRP